MSDINIIVQPTPNPNALKFVCDRAVKADGKTSYKEPAQTKDNPLAQKLFELRGVDQIHFFQNVITISKFSFEPWNALEPLVLKVLEEHLDEHNINFPDHDPELLRRKELSPELLKIEEILDHTVRPGLQADGGDLNCLNYQDNVLIVKYQGACGTCPSSTTGTLEAIRSILKDQYNPEIEVYIAPSEDY